MASSAACLDRRSSDAVGKADRAERRACRKCLREQRLGAAVERLGVQDRRRPGARRPAASVAIADMPEENTAHASVPLIDGKPILDDLAVGVVEARIDEAGRRLPAGGSLRPET